AREQGGGERLPLHQNGLHVLQDELRQPHFRAFLGKLPHLERSVSDENALVAERPSSPARPQSVTYTIPEPIYAAGSGAAPGSRPVQGFPAPRCRELGAPPPYVDAGVRCRCPLRRWCPEPCTLGPLVRLGWGALFGPLRW